METYKKHLFRLISLIITLVLAIQTSASDIQLLSDERSQTGDYTATLSEMAMKRLCVYGVIDEKTTESVVPSRLVAALMLYRAIGEDFEITSSVTDVIKQCNSANTWIRSIGATGERFGTDPITESRFRIMISRTLKWEMEDFEEIEEKMREYGIEAEEKTGKFSMGEICQIICNMMDHAYPLKCTPKREKVSTPKAIVFSADSYDESITKLKKAASYLPQKIEIRFSAAATETDKKRFLDVLDWETGQKTMPLLEIANPRWINPTWLETTGEGCILHIHSYSQTIEASASIGNWLNVYKDRNYADRLRAFYIENLVPLKFLPEQEKVVYCRNLLCRLAEYDTTEVDNGTRKVTGQRPQAHDILGFIENAKIVCDGYSFVFSWMLHELKIENYIVNGKIDNRAHTWNKVRVDGEWYNSDVCFDDNNTPRWQFSLRDDKWMENFGYTPTIRDTPTAHAVGFPALRRVRAS